MGWPCVEKRLWKVKLGREVWSSERKPVWDGGLYFQGAVDIPPLDFLVQYSRTPYGNPYSPKRMEWEGFLLGSLECSVEVGSNGFSSGKANSEHDFLLSRIVGSLGGRLHVIHIGNRYPKSSQWYSLKLAAKTPWKLMGLEDVTRLSFWDAISCRCFCR